MVNERIVLITGGTGDIGTAIAKQLHQSYAKIFALDVIPEEEGASWQEALQQQGYENIFFSMIS